MPDYLVLSLVAPMGAFGDLAGHERRGTHVWPGRSALLGLIGAALGVPRDDQAGQAALKVWKSAVSVLSSGTTWQDFHTVQTVPASRIKRPSTRADALAALHRGDNGLITRRDYRSDCAFGVALWGGDIASLEQALIRPVFTPYLGRKSCPLSAPMAPRTVSSPDPVQALSQIKLPCFINLDPRHPQVIASDIDLTGLSGISGPCWQETRWDDPQDRDAWHFDQRIVYLHRRDPDA